MRVRIIFFRLFTGSFIIFHLDLSVKLQTCFRVMAELQFTLLNNLQNTKNEEKRYSAASSRDAPVSEP